MGFTQEGCAVLVEDFPQFGIANFSESNVCQQA
jgi:hypothetical protein